MRVVTGKQGSRIRVARFAEFNFYFDPIYLTHFYARKIII